MEVKIIEKKKIIIAGSRDFDNYDLLKEKCNEILKNYSQSSITIISGTARGADKLGEKYANEHGFNLVRMPANWTELGKGAGYVRNAEMAKYAVKEGSCGVLIAFTNGSKGTKHMIDLAERYKLDIHIIRFD